MTNHEAITKLTNIMHDDHYAWHPSIIEAFRLAVDALRGLPSAQPEQRWIPCGKCIHADGKHRWCKVLDRTINEDYFCYWAEPFREEGETDD